MLIPEANEASWHVQYQEKKVSAAARDSGNSRRLHYHSLHILQQALGNFCMPRTLLCSILYKCSKSSEQSMGCVMAKQEQGKWLWKLSFFGLIFFFSLIHACWTDPDWHILGLLLSPVPLAVTQPLIWWLSLEEGGTLSGLWILPDGSHISM